MGGMLVRGKAPRGYEWTVEGTRAGPRDTRRLGAMSECRCKIDKKGWKISIFSVSL
jgi:hypothetical protein